MRTDQVGDEDDDLAMISNQKWPMSSLSRSGSGSGSNNASIFKKPKQNDPLDLYDNKTSSRQTELGETYTVKEELRDHVLKYNRVLRRRYDLRDTINPVCLNDIDDSNEWLTERLDDDNDRDDELVFTAEDNYAWNDIATVLGVG
ncbi:hypothetical protein QYF36_015216 [Acer negundo]|nr:hypothetical protein QYF36_015216 [Acer negundo]